MRRLLIFAFLSALASCGGSESSDQYIEKARQHLEASSYKAAAIELKNALRLDTDAAEARWLLGKLYLDTGEILLADKELRQARELGWSEKDVRPALARALLSQGKYAEVFAFEYDDLPPLAAADILASKAMASTALGDSGRAASLVEHALERAPESVEVKLVEARIFAMQGDSTGALIVLEEVLEAAPDEADAWNLKGELLLQRQELAEARDAFGKAIKHAPHSDNVRFKRGLVNLQLGEVESARADAASLLKTSATSPAGNYIQGLIDFQGRDYAAAISALSLAEPAADQLPRVLFYLGSAHFIEGNLDQAANAATRYVSLAPNSVQGRKLLANIRLKQRQPREVQELLQPVIDAQPNDIGALNLMANALLLDGKADQGLDLLARIAELQPDSPEAQVRLALMTPGTPEEAGRHLEAALAIDPEFQQAEILLVMNELRNENFEGAVAAAKAYQESHPNKVLAYNLLGRAYLAAERTGEASDAFAGALELAPGDPAANLSLGKMSLDSGDAKAARSHYRAILEVHPDNLPTLVQLAWLEASEGNQEAMVTRLQQAIDAHPTALGPRLVLARSYFRAGELDKVTPLFATLGEMQRQALPVLELTAEVQLAQGEYEDAYLTLGQMLKASPATAQYHYLLARAAGGSGDATRMKQALLRAVELDPTHVPSLTALARLAMEEQVTADFDRYLQALVKIAPESTEVLRLQALAARRTGDAADAAKFAESAYAAGPSTQTVLELAVLQRAAGRQDRAWKLLHDWLSEHPGDTLVRLKLARYLLLEGDTRAANAQYQAVLDVEPDNIDALNNLAWNLRLEDSSRALEYIRKAAKLAPEQAAVLDTLAVIEHLNGEHRVAYRNIQRALTAAPGNPTISYHKAMIESALGDNDQAIVTLQALLGSSAARFPERAEAEELLAKLVR
ncbi:XrtA/PEP-CTERM system TPR-repeat protein PrsT [Seongchinamella sediminis]|nr:XrtA/PEP-CTERM system TPR-repeat protein PrsT [Seongchinamella sediminis]